MHAIRTLDTFEPRCARSCAHRGYGVRPGHYKLMGDALPRPPSSARRRVDRRGRAGVDARLQPHGGDDDAGRAPGPPAGRASMTSAERARQLRACCRHRAWSTRSAGGCSPCEPTGTADRRSPCSTRPEPRRVAMSRSRAVSGGHRHGERPARACGRPRTPRRGSMPARSERRKLDDHRVLERLRRLGSRFRREEQRADRFEAIGGIDEGISPPRGGCVRVHRVRGTSAPSHREASSSRRSTTSSGRLRAGRCRAAAMPRSPGSPLHARSRGLSKRGAGSGEIALRDAGPSPPELLLGQRKAERCEPLRLAGRGDRAFGIARTRRRHRELGQHEPAGTVHRVALAPRTASPNQRHAVSTLPLRSADRPPAARAT